MELNFSIVNETTRIELFGQLWDKSDLQQVEDCLSTCLQKSSKAVVVDLSRLTFISSQGLGMLIREYMRVTQSQRKFIVYSPAQTISEMFEIAGFYQIMKVVHSDTELQNELDKE